MSASRFIEAAVERALSSLGWQVAPNQSAGFRPVAELADWLEIGRVVVRAVIEEYTRLSNLRTEPGIDSYCVFDTERDHYMQLSWGWTEKRRIKNIFIY